MELDEELKEKLVESIREGKPIPLEYKNLLFPPEEVQGEYELVYKGKKKKEDILADTMSVPFQAVKKFGNVREGGWHNKLIFGDNLQALKHLMNDPDVYDQKTRQGKIRLIYIDPPFGTGDIYDAKGAPAYSAALRGAEYIESLRERLVFLHELLAPDGSIYLRIDYHFGHYIKAIMDEIFGKNNFRNELIINRTKRLKSEGKKFYASTDSVFFYTKSDKYYFDHINIDEPYEIKLKVKKGCNPDNVIKNISDTVIDCDIKYKKGKVFLRNQKWVEMHASSEKLDNPARVFFEKKIKPPRKRRWMWNQEPINEMIRKGFIRINSKNGLPELIRTWRHLGSDWTDIKGYSQSWDYPTENSEELLDRIIRAGSNGPTKENPLGDIVLDCYAGSGTTGAVAEKLGRRWIMVDSSKLAIYTMMKRMFNLREKIGNKGKPLKPTPFVLYNAGLYEDHGFILKMGEDNYKNFALELFQCEPKDFEINGLSMDGLLFNCPVKVFSQKGYLTEEYVDELHNTVGEYIKARMFIIAPASRVYFLQDYIEKKGIRYYVLRIPYSVIDELHKRQFTRPMQPASEKEINQNIEQIGFDFIHPPEAKARYYIKQPLGEIFKEMVIEIEEFEAVQRVKEPVKFKDPKDALSMVLVDTDYNSQYFNITHRFFADEIKKAGYKVRIRNPKPGQKIMIIYIDIFGNERVEVKSIEDFKKANVY